MKYLIFIFSFIFLLQGHTVTLVSDLLSNTHQHATHNSCAEEESSPSSHQSDCGDCFHVHLCCHIKLIEPNSLYDFQLIYLTQSYHDLKFQYFGSPLLEGPFQPPKHS